MRLSSTSISVKAILLFALQYCFLSTTLQAQQPTIKDYVLFSGNGTCAGGQGQRPPKAPGFAVQLGAASNIQGGSVGSYQLVKSTGPATINSNIYSGGIIQLAGSNVVSGKIAAANFPFAPGTAIFIGPNAAVSGNIDANGNITIGGGAVSGTVRHPAGTSYSGPVPGGGNVIAAPAIPGLPQMPAIAKFPASAHIPDINSTKIITPGAYGGISLQGNKTITFSGTGNYVFDKIDNRGSANYFVFDFKNNPSGTFKIYVQRDADLGKIVVSMINGGSATRIFTEVHGNGSSCSNKTWGFNIDNGYSASTCAKWLGTVWVPYGPINIGSGSGNSAITGALWSGMQVNIQCGAKIIYAPYSECTAPDVNAGPDKSLDFVNPTTLTATSSIPGVKYNWQAISGGVLTSTANTAAVTVSSAGTYIVTATTTNGCSANDTVIVTGKTNSIIGAELQSIFENFDPNGPPSPFFVIQHDSIFIDIIAKEGTYAATLSLLKSPAYGLTNILSNGASNFIITGLYKISKLPLLNALGSSVVYVRPYYKAFKNSGLVTSAGDTSVRANLVRSGYKIQGDGVKVGVISDSYNAIRSATTNPITNTAAQDVGNDDLPGVGNLKGNTTPVHVLQDYPQGADEGRGMLQIVHDIAPKAELYFRTGFISGGDFAAGIGELKQAGCNVIVDDVTFITEPFLKDGVVANAVDAAVAGGTTYFSAAGNFASKSYENSFNPIAAPGGITGTAHNFGGNDVFQNVTLPPGDYTIVLQWLDDIYSLGQTSAGGTKNDLDIYLTPNTDGTALFGFNRNNTNGDPIEILPFTITGTVNTNILITNNTIGSTPARFKYIVFRGDMVINEYNTGTSTIVGQANAAGAIAVGAVRYDKVAPFPGPIAVEDFSSRGGTVINNVQRNKPELVAPDGVNTTVNLGSDYDKNLYTNFFGTSAAAPHVAAVAALIMEGKKKFLNQATTSPAEMRTILQNTATNIGAAGFDLVSGYGLVNADSAMRTFAQPDPSIIQLVLPPSVVAGTAPFTLTLTGINFSANSVINFRGVPLPTTVINSGEVRAVIPAFTGNPAISVYTPPISPSKLDGGYSDTVYFFKQAKKNIIITADNKTKKYGEKLPGFTATILIDSVPIQKTTLTIKDLGLDMDSLKFATLATESSNVGTYSLIPSRVFDPGNPTDQGLQELYTYTFNPGTFTIEKLPVTLTPKDTTVTYGQKISSVQFAYKFDGANFTDSIAFLHSIAATHRDQLAKDALGNDVFGLINKQAVTIFNKQAVTIFNGQAVTIFNGQAVTIFNGQQVPVINAQSLTIQNGIVTDTVGKNLTAAQFKDLNFLTTLPSLQNARQLTNRTLKNGVYEKSITNVVDITQESILDYNVNAAQTNMLSSVSNADAKGLVDKESFLNGQAVTIFNGQAVTIFNGQAVTIFNGQAVTIFNGQAVTIFNGDTIPIVNSQNKTAVIVNSTEIGAPQSQLKSLNMITGFNAGNQFIIPGSLVNDNFDITYNLGKLTILPAPLTIKAKDTTKAYGKSFNFSSNSFTISEGVLMYGDSIKSVGLSSTGAETGAPAGNYPIIISNAMGASGTDLANYSIKYVNGTMCVLKLPVIVKANDTCKVYGDINPSFTASYSGLVNGQTFATSGITGAPQFSTTATTTSGVDKYPITVTTGSLSSPDYSFSFSPGILTIIKACLNVKAEDKVIDKGDALPTFTSKIVKFKAGDNTGVAYSLSPACTGSAGIYTIIPELNPFINAKNYNISYTNGKLYINPKGMGAKKLNIYLDCVDQLSEGKYLAHFRCVNDNSTPVYVPVGNDNKLSSTGAFDNLHQPYIFIPGTTKYEVAFDGTSLKWELRTYDCYLKTSTSASANTSSARCNIYTSGRAANATNGVKAPVNGDLQKAPSGNINVYPNPASKRAIIYIANELINEKALSLYDSYGRLYPVKMTRRISSSSVEIDVSGLVSGMYFMRVKVADGFKSVSITKE